ncbi:MAG: hypothetical protein RIB03_10545 [Henriciella sp.]|uniref:hypothetical protein n=1 Tax=Henriciella sp. TaxID=1968823 RepID=UPI0026117141|nr:hypothetical protein [Henriciella sp.]
MMASRIAPLALLLACLTAACGNDREPIRFEYAETVMDICAEAVIGFPTDSATLSETAQAKLYDAVDQLGTDCEGASIEIISFADQAGDQMAYARTATVEDAIVTSYGISDSRIAKSTEEAPSLEMADHVRIALMVEVPVEDE